MRWGVHGCSLGLAVLIGVAAWYPRTLEVSRTTPGVNGWTAGLDISVDEYRLSVVYSPPEPSEGVLQPGWFIDLHASKFWYGMSGQWWSPPILGSQSPFQNSATSIEMPLVYPTGISVLISMWLIWRRMKSQACVDSCSSCGYSLEGLTTTTCPECGATITYA